MAGKTNLSVFIDIGTSKIAGLAGLKNSEGKLEIRGAVRFPAKGFKRGVVLNIDEAASSVERVVKALEKQTEGKIDQVDIAFAGQPMRIYEHKGSRLTSGDGIVTQNDVNELYHEAQSLKIKEDFVLLHIVPQGYRIDDDISELNPAGITGQKIEATYKLIAVPEIHLTNLERILNQAGVKLGKVTFSPLAVSEAVLTDDEKEMGTILLDIGAGTTKLAVFHEGIMVHTSVIPFGGEVISKDIREGCSILPKWAEQLKIQFGQALGDFADGQKVVTIPGHSGWDPKEISFKNLAFIIQARMEEIIDSAFYQIEQSGMTDRLGSGIVLTGGTSAMNNLISLVKFRTGMDARRAFPVFRPVTRVKGTDHSDYFTAMGLMRLALQEADPAREKKRKVRKKRKESGFSPWLKGVVQGVLDYVDDDEDVEMK